jgi:hypothetical protein
MCVGVLTTRGLLTVAADGPTACIDSFHEPYRRFPHAIVLHHSTPEQAYAACKQQDHDVSAAQSVKPNFALGQTAGCAEDQGRVDVYLSRTPHARLGLHNPSVGRCHLVATGPDSGHHAVLKTFQQKVCV